MGIENMTSRCERLTISSQDSFSEILIQKGLLQRSDWINHLNHSSSSFVIITDHYVRKLFGHFLKQKLEERGYPVHLCSMPPGEKNKTRKWKERLENEMLKAGCGKESLLIALGGGVVTDMGGFIAATYARGIPFISIPTTLLGQIDAAIGGKVGINTSLGKNLIGSFYFPRMIFIDIETLLTLPQRELLNGRAEMIKYALINSKELFKKLENKIPLGEGIEECIAIKKQIVEKDPNERGIRHILNFGHTVGHAIETATHYHVSHGEAVALGISVESHLSFRLGYLAEKDNEAIQNLLTKSGFPFQLSLDVDKLIEIINRDKKALLGAPRFVLLEGIGKTVEVNGTYCHTIDPKIMKEVLWQHFG